MSNNRDRGGLRDYNDEFDPEDEPSGQEPVSGGTVIDSGEARVQAPAQTPVASRVVVPDRNQSCVMLGPAGSGKTTLLTAIKRACDQPADDELNLEFIPGKETAEKIRDAIQNIVARKEGHAATLNVGNYPFEVHVSAKAPNFWTPPLEEELHVIMSDGGGGFLLPHGESYGKDEYRREFRKQLVDTALDATSMILCVDVTKPGSEILEKELAISFADVSRPKKVLSTVHWTAKAWSRIRRKPLPHPRERWKSSLNVDRFLLLLTQVDKLCHQLPKSVDRTVRFAEMIDPVEQARELLGVPILKTIQNSLKPGACFAVGVISAMGFHPRTGDPFADIDGTPINLFAESGEDVLRRWTPFGIRDAIYFLATGKCRGRVKELRPVDLRVGAEPLEFTFSAISHKEA